MNSLPWYLNLNINNVRNLFSQIELPYEIDCYICVCGHNEIIIKGQNSILEKYTCIHCENTNFYNANVLNNNYSWYEPIYNLFNENYLFSISPTISYDENTNTINAIALIRIPVDIDLSTNTIRYINKKIFEVNIDDTANYIEQLHANFCLENGLTQKEIMYNEYVTEQELINRNVYLYEFKNKILNELKNLKNFKNYKLLEKVSNIEEFLFFVKNDHLIDIDFYKWKNIELLPRDEKLTILKALNFVMGYRKEKSLKKLIFDNYKFQMKEFNSYDFIYIYSIARTIKDINILNRMVNINLKSHIKRLSNHFDLYIFMNYLTTKFEEKQIEKLFIAYEKEDMFWFVDTVAIFSEIVENVDELLVNKCKLEDLHNDILRFHQVKLDQINFDITFTYTEQFLKACEKVLDYEVRLPKNGVELYDWSNKLQNCLSGYCRLIRDKKTIVYGFFIDDVIKFAVEIRNNKIEQSKSKYNKDIQDKEMHNVKGWFMKNFNKEYQINLKDNQET